MRRFQARLMDRPALKVRGSYATEDVAVGQVNVPVAEAGAFNDEDGGTARLRLSDGDADVPPADVVVDYAGWDGDDEDVEYLILAAPLAQALPAGTRVDVWDPVTSTPDVVYEAPVMPDDATLGSRPLTATVHPDLIDTLTPETLPGPGESVLIEEDEDEDTLYLTRVLGQQLNRDGSYLDPDTLPPVEVIPTTPPAAPTNLTVVPKAYLAGRVPSSRFNLSWSGVSTDETGASISDVRGYDVDEQPSGAPWRFRTHTTDLAVAVSPYVPDSVWSFRVRAVREDGTVGAWSSSVTVTAPRDTEAPPVPSKPTASARLGVARFGWGGFSSTGAAMPADFDRVEVHVSTTDGFTPTVGATATLLGSITGAGELVKSDGTYNMTYYVRLIAVDLWGNASAPSAQEFAIVKPLVDTDVIGQAVSGANIKDGTITASDKVVANSVTSALIQALAIQAGHISANAVTADKVEAGAIVADKIAANAVTAAKIMAEAVTAEKIKAAAITAGKIDTGAITATKIAAAAVTATSLSADAIDGKTITGALIRSAASGQRWELGRAPAGTQNQLLGYTGASVETAPGEVSTSAGTQELYTQLISPGATSWTSGKAGVTVSVSTGYTPPGQPPKAAGAHVRIFGDDLDMSDGVRNSVFAAARTALGVNKVYRQTVTVNFSASATATTTITFPTGTFDTTPTVTVTSTNSGYYGYRGAVSSTSVIVGARALSGTPTVALTLDVVAVG